MLFGLLYEMSLTPLLDRNHIPSSLFIKGKEAKEGLEYACLDMFLLRKSYNTLWTFLAWKKRQLKGSLRLIRESFVK